MPVRPENFLVLLVAGLTLHVGPAAAVRAEDRYATGTMFAPPPTAAGPGAAQPRASVAPPAVETAIMDVDDVAARPMTGAEVIARIDSQVILACDVIWKVNLRIESLGDRIASAPPAEIEKARRELMKNEIAALVDRKLLYAEFRRNLPAEAWPQIEENLLKPFDEMEMPLLQKQLNVDRPAAVEQELIRLGSSLQDARRAFNERAIASEMVRSKVKINEEVGPDEMLTYYQAHIADYEYPTRVRWEELAVKKSRYQSPQEARAAIAYMGNEVWNRAATGPTPPRGAVFAEVARAKSDGFTAKEGGLHDWTTQGALKATAIDQWLFSSEIGQMSPILDSGDSFHIVRVLERQEAGRRPFTEVQGDIREKLKDERFEVALQEHLTKLRKGAKIWTIFTGPTTPEELMGMKPGTERR